MHFLSPVIADPGQGWHGNHLRAGLLCAGHQTRYGQRHAGTRVAGRSRHGSGFVTGCNADSLCCNALNARPSAADAQAAALELRQRRLSEHDISVLYTDAGHTIKAGLLGGAVWGGVFGALLGLLFPPAGLLIAAEPIAGVLASGAALGAAGALTLGALDGLVAGLVHLGLPQETATVLAGHVHKGDTLVMAHASSAELTTQSEQVLAAHHPRAETTPSGVVSATSAGS